MAGIRAVSQRQLSFFVYCRIRPGKLLYDNERDMLAIAKFVVINTNQSRIITL